MLRGTWEVGRTVSAGRHSLTHSLLNPAHDSGFAIVWELRRRTSGTLAGPALKPGFFGYGFGSRCL